MTSSIVDHPLIDRCVQMALAGISREFPCQFPLALDAPTSFCRPRDWVPTFYGCYDWHSAVHSHWLLIRWLSTSASSADVSPVISVLENSFTTEKLAAEHRFLSHPDRVGFERPYGLAWLLQLTAELRTSRHPLAVQWLNSLRPLEELAASRFRTWLPRLAAPVRTGEHGQTAFALGLVSDWACDTGDLATANLVEETAHRFFAEDSHLPLRWEPSGHDFLSPSLATADLMRRILTPCEFAEWLARALPGLPLQVSLPPVRLSLDLRDGKLAHLAGLNFSRAWMLDGIAHGLPEDDLRRPGLVQLAQDHLTIGIPALDSNEYSVTHWVGSFAMYALTRRGIAE